MSSRSSHGTKTVCVCWRNWWSRTAVSVTPMPPRSSSVIVRSITTGSVPAFRMRALDRPAGAGDVEVQRLLAQARRDEEARDAAHGHGRGLGEEDGRQRGRRLAARDEEVLRHLVLLRRNRPRSCSAGGYAPDDERGQLELRLPLRVVRQRARRPPRPRPSRSAATPRRNSSADQRGRRRSPGVVTSRRGVRCSSRRASRSRHRSFRISLKVNRPGGSVFSGGTRRSSRHVPLPARGRAVEVGPARSLLRLCPSYLLRRNSPLSPFSLSRSRTRGGRSGPPSASRRPRP